MVVVSLRYAFRQPLRAPAPEAYAWATDFQPSDAALFGDRRRRTVRRTAPDTVLLTDTTPGPGRSTVRITRLVRLFPERLAWTNTHLTGPYRHSQFWYAILRDGPERSYLDFCGLKLERRERALTPSATARAAEANGRSDAATWKRKLAPALEREIGTDRPVAAP